MTTHSTNLKLCPVLCIKSSLYVPEDDLQLHHDLNDGAVIVTIEHLGQVASQPSLIRASDNFQYPTGVTLVHHLQVYCLGCGTSTHQDPMLCLLGFTVPCITFKSWTIDIDWALEIYRTAIKGWGNSNLVFTDRSHLPS